MSSPYSLRKLKKPYPQVHRNFSYLCKVKFIYVILMILLGLSASSAEFSKGDMERALTQLDREIEKRDSYVAVRQAYLDSLRRRLTVSPPPTGETVRLMLELGNGYTAFNNDSALWMFEHGAKIARDLGEDSLATVLKLRYATFLPLAGFMAQAEETFNSIDTTDMSPAIARLRLAAGRQMFSYISTCTRSYPTISEKYSKLSNDMGHRLAMMPDDGSLDWRLNLGEYYYNHQNYQKAEQILRSVAESAGETDNHFARAAHMLSGIARARGDNNAVITYLAKSAIADLKTATLEITSLQQLGMMMYENDDISRANEYLAIALKNAVDCHALMRVVETGEVMPLITSAHEIAQARNRHMLVGILIAMAVLLAGLASLLLVIRREMHHLSIMKERLSAANRVKEIYLTQFLNLCSVYMDKLSSFSKTVHRKLSTGKADDLLKLIKSGKFVEEHSREFYEMFDDAFLHIYPTFVDDVNALLRPEEQIELRDGERLNTDLRILAFMRLGIEESTRIARILNYSVYTIYTYRNKLRNRAIKRDSFEHDILSIGAI